MKHTQANEIIKTHQLLPGKLSRNILRAIVNNTEIKDLNFLEYITGEQIDMLRALYQKKLAELGQEKGDPKYLPFYHIIKDKIKNFSWAIDVDEKNKILSSITAPRIKNLRPSLLSLLLGKINGEFDTELHRKYFCINQLSSSVVRALNVFFKNTKVIYPSEDDMQKIVGWLSSALHHKESTIFIPVCPDYSAEPTGDSACPMRHTFDSLGEGNGQIAQRILNMLPHLKNLLGSLEISPNIVVGLGDFEAYAESNLKRLNLTTEEFLRKLTLSKNAFTKACCIPTHIAMITDLCGGKMQWEDYAASVSKKFGSDDFGQTQITHQILIDIARKRGPLYSRWYGHKSSLEEYIPIILAQGIEYAAMGAMLAEKYKNCIVLGADNDVMRYFYSMVKPIPTLYFKRFYC